MADNNAQEPSMEEILASIRRIISEDEDEIEQTAPKTNVAAGHIADDQDDILDLAAEDVLPEESPLESAATEDAPFAADTPVEETEVMELTEMVEDTPKAETSEKILSEQTAQKASQPFSQLSGLLVRDYPGAENTLDGLMREMLRPMLKEWLDAHLPAVVERMVAKEIARLTDRD
ncbi:MAG: DUF2497 domain-containing protein [Sphingomonadales bacterium]|jgi:cell pole-organizing protein PopZ